MASIVRRTWIGAAAAASIALLTSGMGWAEAESHLAAPEEDCKIVSKSQFPGSGISNLRYGEIEVTYEVCGSDPSSWSHSLTKQVTNDTGYALGFNRGDSAVKAKEIGEDKRVDELIIPAKTCYGYVDTWILCSAPYELKAELTVDQSGNIEITDKETPDGMALFDTP